MKSESRILFGLATLVITYCALAYIFMWSPVVTYKDETPAYACENNLRQLDAATCEWALEHGKHNGDPVHLADLTPYVKLNLKGELYPCPEGGSYKVTVVGASPICSLGTNPSVPIRQHYFFWHYSSLAGVHHRLPQVDYSYLTTNTDYTKFGGVNFEK